jgi:hypothetical protein
MIDGSHLSFEENIALTRKVVEYAVSQKPSPLRGTPFTKGRVLVLM